MQAKKRRREVWVDYHPLNRSDSSRWRIRPYRFVSNPLSDGFYVLCDGSRDGADYISLSLKFDRIQDVRLCDEKFEIVDLARFQSHFGRAWGVWSSGRGEPTTVVLRFERRHYDRLLESAWHPTQRITADADDYVRYSVDVAEPDEMVPWIRSWGSGVVVEEPEELRRRIVRSLKRQVQHYGLTMNDNKNADALHLLWAKRDPMGKPKAETSKQHLLIYHLLDVAAAACCMWDDVLSAGQKIWLQDLLGSDEIAARRQLALLAGLHDIGKATPGFQKKARDRYDALCQADEDLREKHSHIDDHGILSAAILRRWLIDKNIGKWQAGQLAGVIGGHHGSWISSYTGQAAGAGIGRERWQALQDKLIAQLRATLGAQKVRLPDDPQRIPSDLDSLLAEVQPRFHQGGCIAIVCNTVNESIDVARFLREAQGIDANDVWLFHARFPPVWRAEIEDEALAAFGKEAADRPRRKILVATQIIEQSLDLDFDLMVSRVAPIDLLIQRVGRLQRHAGRSRPPHLSEPTLLLRAPDIVEGDVPDFGVDEVIYARFFLLKSWLKLRDMDALRSPDDIDALMDFVYSEEVPVDGISSAYRKALVDAWDELKLDDKNREFRGAMKRIGKPSDESIVGGDDDKLPDDEALKIHTRDIQPGIDIICLVDESLKSIVERKLPPGKENRQEEISTLLKHKVTVRGKIRHALEQLEENRHWQRIAQLKFARAIPFTGDSFEVPNSPFSLRLTKDYGLEISNEEDA